MPTQNTWAWSMVGISAPTLHECITKIKTRSLELSREWREYRIIWISKKSTKQWMLVWQGKTLLTRLKNRKIILHPFQIAGPFWESNFFRDTRNRCIHLEWCIDFQQCPYIPTFEWNHCYWLGDYFGRFNTFCFYFSKKTNNLKHSKIVYGTSNLEWREYYININGRFLFVDFWISFWTLPMMEYGLLLLPGRLSGYC